MEFLNLVVKDLCKSYLKQPPNNNIRDKGGRESANVSELYEVEEIGTPGGHKTAPKG